MPEIVQVLIVFLGCSLIGWIFVGVALHVRRYQRKKELNERSLTFGRIVDVAEKVHHGGRGGTIRSYFPVVEFEACGRVYRLENENGTRNRESIVTGRSVDILYDPADPARFHLADDDANVAASDRLLRTGLIIIAGAAVLAAAGYAVRLY